MSRIPRESFGGINDGRGASLLRAGSYSEEPDQHYPDDVDDEEDLIKVVDNDEDQEVSVPLVHPPRPSPKHVLT